MNYVFLQGYKGNYKLSQNNSEAGLGLQSSITYTHTAASQWKKLDYTLETWKPDSFVFLKDLTVNTGADSEVDYTV